jgi:hypothetical protein
MAVIAVAVILAGAAPAFGQANQSGGPAPISDYENYPLNLGLIPEGCTAQGPAVLVGALYRVNGGPPATDLGLFADIPQDAVVTMTWDAFAPGCEGIGVTLSRKGAGAPTFDPNINQWLNVWSYCGPGGPACVAPYSLTLDLSASPFLACYQMDANIGPPLEVVGPDGAFYSLDQPFNMLISAQNGGTQPCTLQPCPLNPNIPITAHTCIDAAVTTTTTVPPPPPPTITVPPVPDLPPPPAVTVLPTTTTQAPGVCPAGQVFDMTTLRCVAVAGAQLPFTGSSSGDLARMGLALLLGGGLLVGAVHRWRTAAQPSR